MSLDNFGLPPTTNGSGACSGRSHEPEPCSHGDSEGTPAVNHSANVDGIASHQDEESCAPPLSAPTTAGTREPSGELPAAGRLPNGTFAPGNTEALKHGARSVRVRAALLPEQAEALAALAEHRVEIERDLGGVEQLSALTRDMVSRYLELRTVADYLGHRIVTEGPLTTKGRQRAALSAFLGVVDRLQRVALTLGLERRQKPVVDFAEAFTQVER